MSSNDESKPTFIVDEGWKAKVQAEKEQAQVQAQPTGAQDAPPPDTEPPLPPASFSMLLTTLATQALAALGQLRQPGEEEPRRQPLLAKHLIDTLGILEEKTKGNLTPAEQAMLARVQHDLRMLYIASPH